MEANENILLLPILSTSPTIKNCNEESVSVWKEVSPEASEQNLESEEGGKVRVCGGQTLKTSMNGLPVWRARRAGVNGLPVWRVPKPHCAHRCQVLGVSAANHAESHCVFHGCN